MPSGSSPPPSTTSTAAPRWTTDLTYTGRLWGSARCSGSSTRRSARGKAALRSSSAPSPRTEPAARAALEGRARARSTRSGRGVEDVVDRPAAQHPPARSSRAWVVRRRDVVDVVGDDHRRRATRDRRRGRRGRGRAARARRGRGGPTARRAARPPGRSSASGRAAPVGARPTTASRTSARRTGRRPSARGSPGPLVVGRRVAVPPRLEGGEAGGAHRRRAHATTGAAGRRGRPRRSPTRRRSSRTSVRPSRSPSTSTTPDVGWSYSAATRSSDVLPLPLGPSTSHRSPSPTANDTSSRIERRAAAHHDVVEVEGDAAQGRRSRPAAWSQRSGADSPLIVTQPQCPASLPARDPRPDDPLARRRVPSLAAVARPGHARSARPAPRPTTTPPRRRRGRSPPPASQANEAAADFFAAQSDLELLADEAAAAGRRRTLNCNKRSMPCGTQVEQVAVNRFVSSGSSGIPLLTGYQQPSEQLQTDVLVDVVTESSADAMDDFDEARSARGQPAARSPTTRPPLEAPRRSSTTSRRRPRPRSCTSQEVEANGSRTSRCARRWRRNGARSSASGRPRSSASARQPPQSRRRPGRRPAAAEAAAPRRRRRRPGRRAQAAPAAAGSQASPASSSRPHQPRRPTVRRRPTPPPPPRTAAQRHHLPRRRIVRLQRHLRGRPFGRSLAPGRRHARRRRGTPLVAVVSGSVAVQAQQPRRQRRVARRHPTATATTTPTSAPSRAPAAACPRARSSATSATAATPRHAAPALRGAPRRRGVGQPVPVGAERRLLSVSARSPRPADRTRRRCRSRGCGARWR